MPAKRINQIIGDLPFERKLLGTGALLMAISAFLPWYQDLDSFKTGDVFLGLSGPTYLAGLTILGVAIVDLVLIFIESSDRKLPLISFKPSSFYLASGLISFYLLLMVNSIFFHNKFGVNITSKDSQFGMFMAFIAASLMTIGGYLATREKASILNEFREKTAEPMIKIPDRNQERKAREITRPVPAQPFKPAQPSQMMKPLQTMIEENTVNSPSQKFKPEQYYRPSAVTNSAPAASVQVPRVAAPLSAPKQKPAVISGAPAHNENKAYQPFRTDL